MWPPSSGSRGPSVNSLHIWGNLAVLCSGMHRTYIVTTVSFFPFTFLRQNTQSYYSHKKGWLASWAEALLILVNHTQFPSWLP